MESWAVIGNPVTHSLSPVMHNRVINSLGLNAKYERVCLAIDHFDRDIQLFMKSGVTGFNITVPFKERIVPYLDEIHGTALTSKAVNTAVYKNGKWHGYNTDGDGFFIGLEEIRPVTSCDRILIIGAGGASKGIFLTLHEKTKAQLTVTNRTFERAVKMVKRMGKGEALPIFKAEEKLADFSIVIQTTSLGLDLTQESIPLSLANLKKGTIVSDVIYNPMETKFLQIARRKEAKTQNGLAMFVNQGALSFQHWTGIKPDRALMKEAILKALKEKRKLC